MLCLSVLFTDCICVALVKKLKCFTVCQQAADRFMHMLELHGGPEHLVVFITSDQVSVTSG